MFFLLMNLKHFGLERIEVWQVLTQIIKRSSTYACSPVGKARRVTINADANKTRLVPYYGRPAQSPELAKKCFYTQDDCARPAASRITCVLPAF